MCTNFQENSFANLMEVWKTANLKSNHGSLKCNAP